MPSRFITFAFALCALASPALAQRARLDSVVRTTTLENGLQVVAIQNSTIPFVTVELVVKAGAQIQVADSDQGVPHLLEHMLFRGDDGFQSAASKIDAGWNGETGAESVRYFLTFPAQHLAKGLDLMSDLIRKPNFSEDLLKLERQIVIGELERHASEPMLQLMTQGDILLWDWVGWARKNPGGNVLAVNSATPAQLSALYKRFYLPNNAALIVSGDVRDTAVFSLATKAFGSWKRGPDPIPALPPAEVPPVTAIKRNVISADVKDVTFLVRWQGPGVGANKSATYAADVFAGLVNQRLSGTQRRLVDGGYFNSVSLNYETMNHVGPIELMATTSSDRAAGAAAALGLEMQQLAAPTYFDAKDLTLAKKRQQVAARFQLESASTAAHMVASFWSSAGLDYYMGYADGLENQTEATLHQFVNEYLTGKPMIVAVMVPLEAERTVGTAVRTALDTWKVR